MVRIRHLDKHILNHIAERDEVLILLGARQVGKTTLVTRLFPDALYLLVDNESIRKNLEKYDVSVYKRLLNMKLVIIDEIHLLSNPGRAAKIIHDQLSSVKLIVTGSSALNIKNRTSESLAGRKIDYQMFPLTFSEYLLQTGVEKKLNHNIYKKITGKPSESVHSFDLSSALETALRYGLYPNLVDQPADTRYLRNLVDSSIFKDILELNLIDDRRSALDLLKLLAYQIGQLVNYSEIAQRINKDTRTVKKYIEIFEQSFIIFRLYPYSSGGRDEIGKSPKIFFYDVGIRNALIDNFDEIDLRSDRGQLFENFVICEFLKANEYKQGGYTLNFWRTRHGSEVDLVISKKNELQAIEVKYSKGNIGKSFQNRYPKAIAKIITSSNFY